MPPVGFEPTISAGERPQNYLLDRAATGTDIVRVYLTFVIDKLHTNYVCLQVLSLKEHCYK